MQVEKKNFNGILITNEVHGKSNTRGVPMPSNSEVNLQRLAKTDLPMEFVKAHNGEWNHQDWLMFCAMLEVKGYTPIDLDQVGLLLEKNKTIYWEGGN